MSLSAFIHPKGTPQAPNYTEYEISMIGIEEIVAVGNAEMTDNYVIVIDESKPVFLIICSNYAGCIWKLDDHVKLSSPGKVSLECVLSSDIGAMLVQMNDIPRKNVYIKVRVGVESYCAGGLSPDAKDTSVSGSISFMDLLQFVAGEIPWSALRSHSFFSERKEKKELSRQEKIVELTRELEQSGEELERTNGRLEQVQKDLVRIRRCAEQDQRSLVLVRGKLEKIPRWLRRWYAAE